MAHSSRRRCQSWFDRARRDASKQKIAPTWPNATSPTRILKSPRLLTADWPRSPSRTRICSWFHPKASALSIAKLYWRSVLSGLNRTWPGVGIERMYMQACRVRSEFG